MIHIVVRYNMRRAARVPRTPQPRLDRIAAQVFLNLPVEALLRFTAGKLVEQEEFELSENQEKTFAFSDRNVSQSGCFGSDVGLIGLASSTESSRMIR
jgi:hypothetical protein